MNVNIHGTTVELGRTIGETVAVKRFILLVLALAMISAACGTTADVNTASTEGAGADLAVASDQDSAEHDDPDDDEEGDHDDSDSDASVDEGADTAVAGERGPSGVDGPNVPDFTLTMSDGSTFTLSEGAKPVYMVFWAEW